MVKTKLNEISSKYGTHSIHMMKCMLTINNEFSIMFLTLFRGILEKRQNQSTILKTGKSQIGKVYKSGFHKLNAVGFNFTHQIVY